MRSTHNTRVARWLSAAIVILLSSIALPSNALTVDPRVGTSKVHAPVVQTEQQTEREQAGPKVVPYTGTQPRVEKQNSEPPLASGGNPQAVLAVLGGQSRTSDAPTALAKPAGPNHLLALAIAAAVLGALLGGTVLLVRKGPQPPTIAIKNFDMEE